MDNLKKIIPDDGIRGLELNTIKEQLLQSDIFKNVTELVILEDMISLCKKNGFPVELPTYKIDENTKFSGKLYLFGLSLTPPMLSQDEFLKSIKNSHNISPTMYDAKTFAPYRVITLKVNITEEYGIDDESISKRKEELHQELDEVLGNVEMYSTKLIKHIVLRGIYVDSIDDEYYIGEPKYELIHYSYKKRIIDDTFSFEVYSELLPIEYAKEFKSKYPNLISSDNLIEFFNDNNIKFTYNKMKLDE